MSLRQMKRSLKGRNNINCAKLSTFLLLLISSSNAFYLQTIIFKHLIIFLGFILKLEILTKFHVHVFVPYEEFKDKVHFTVQYCSTVVEAL